ncbi:MAG: methyltransferase domain-containing protein [Nitrospirae bacterium]|nr:methyltransferase domain-containing protein [Nitrospirota bacterium]
MRTGFRPGYIGNGKVKTLPYLEHDAQSSSSQYLEDLATGYWFSEILFTAVEMDIFSLLEPQGSTLKNLAKEMRASPAALSRFLDALLAMKLITSHKGRYYNTSLAQHYLVRGVRDYQGDSILWRKYLQTYWKGLGDCLKTGGRVNYQNDSSELSDRIKNYVRAMDCIARTKAHQIIGFFSGMPLTGNLLDVGAGSGAIAAAFLRQNPELKATLLDLPEILNHTRKLLQDKEYGGRIRYLAGNILEIWPVRKKGFDFVVLSNILHAYSEKELPHILSTAADALKKNGILLIHDFFPEHYPEKAALTDLNMLINTFNGRVFSSSLIQDELQRLGFAQTALLPLETDTALIIASRNETTLGLLQIDPIDRFMAKMQTLGFRKAYRINAKDICMTNWTDIKCRFGCKRYGSPNCPPNSLSPEKTGAMITSYHTAVLVEGEPPARDFQKRVLEAEREAFLGGYHKAFSFWAGPCSLCAICASDGNCRKTDHARPSMEGAGIDVFETARRAGAKVRTLTSRTDYIKYFGLILLD